MKRFLPLVATILLILPITGCRTNENNYRAAYERAMEKDKEGLDSTIYSKIRREASPTTVIVDGQPVAMRREFVSVTPDEGAFNEQLKKYSVIAAQFKQLFHARSLRDRLKDNGYPGAFIVQTAEPLYYVVAASRDDAAEAREICDKLKATSPVALRDPCPWILQHPRK